MKTKNTLLFLSSFLLGITTMNLFASAETTGTELPELQTVSSVDLNRYQGLWHQIAYIPTPFQKNCEIDVTAKYTLREDGNVTVENECSKANGTRKYIKGYAYPAAAGETAKLKVKFFWFAPAGNYWVMELGENYEYAVVGTPDRNYLWILARNPQMLATTYQELLKKIEAQSYDIGRIKVTSPLLEQQPE